MGWDVRGSDGSIKQTLVGAGAAYSVGVYKSADQSIATGSPEVLLTFDSEYYDTASMHDTVTNNSRLVAPVTGVYDLSVSVSFAAQSTGNRYFLVRKNAAGSPAGGTLVMLETQAATVSPTSSVMGNSQKVYLNAGDYVEVFAYQNSGGNLNVSGGVGTTQASLTLVQTTLISARPYPPGYVLASNVGTFTTSSGAGDKISITVTDPPGDVLIQGGGLAYTTGAAGTQLQMLIRDGAGGTGTIWAGAYAHVAGASYQTQLIPAPRVVPQWSGAKTFYLHLNNTAGVPTIYGSASGAPCTLVATVAS